MLDNDVAEHLPSNFDLANVLAVAATTEGDRLASFSNYGATTVDLGAPGVRIGSTVPGGAYAEGQGTSFAAPHVAAAALMLLNKEPALTQAQVEQRLVQAATPDVVTDPKGSPNRLLYLPPPG